MPALFTPYSGDSVLASAVRLIESQLTSSVPEHADMSEFAQWLNTQFPNMVWDKPHHEVIIKTLDRVTAGELNQVMFFLPPRHGKSFLVTQRYTSWRIKQDPTLPAILGAYNQTLANKFSRAIRRIVRESTPMNNERAAVEEWETAAGGGLRSVGVGSGVTGHGGGLLVIDDPIKGREEADSPAYRERLWDWYTDDFYTRREPGAQIILIQTRWHRDDLAGRILASEDGPNWHVVHIPAIAMEDDPLQRDIGDALWPERVPAEDIEKYRAFNERGYWSLYQGMPLPEGGAIYLKEFWDGKNRFDPLNVPAPYIRIMSWDTGEGLTSTSSYTACVVGDLVRMGSTFVFLIRHVWRGRLPFHRMLEQMVDLARVWYDDGRLQEVWIESKSFGSAAINMLRTQAPDWFPQIRGFSPRASKDARGHQAARPCHQGRVWLPEPHEVVPWLPTFEQELYDQPAATFRDQADAFAQSILNPTIAGHIMPENPFAHEEQEAA